ncbi:cell wall-binding repeat-containing protein [Halobacillus salinarum]|uniref:Cell wall-binding repeat-containing protein n=1 Tax=Halobacillus salinarum TaxID=2932257 RepID=A0ABY4EMB8_9BACI|nr:cell wall-binding repeat-containing protein [Halobacillus salinarum]UOQ45591.1 cell wall-binding repeat-containing protein [Halobacillus salinarum]
MLKVIGRFIAMGMVGALFVSLPIHTKAAEKVTPTDINEMLTDAAVKKGIPPEVAKAVAHKESLWTQWEDAAQTEPFISEDGGIGIMQVTSHICAEGQSSSSCYDREKLENDIEYNINAGLEILNEKWGLAKQGVIPTINDGKRDELESWYFAVMAYNGLKPVNSPVDRDGNRNLTTYQDGVFNRLSDYSLDQDSLTELPFSREDFSYDRNSDENITFNKMDYDVKKPLTKSRQLYEADDQVYIPLTSNLKAHPSDGSGKTVENQLATVLDSKRYYDSSLQSSGRQWVRYKVKTENGDTGYVASSVMKPLSPRLSGTNRIETAVEVAKEGWENGADTVVLARADKFPDALAGAPLAYQLDAPILLTETDRLPEETKQVIEQLGAEKAVLLGGKNGAITEHVRNTLETSMGLDTKRIAGTNRYETARAIADELDSDSDSAIIAYGGNFPDALAAAPYAARHGMPIILTEKDKLNAATKAALNGVKRTVVVGGTGVVSEKVFKELPNPQRKAGTNRYETAAVMSDYANLGHVKGYVVTGEKFADALTGSVLAAKEDAPLLLVNGSSLPEETESFIKGEGISDYVLLGGPGAVNPVKPLAKLSYDLEN